MAFDFLKKPAATKIGADGRRYKSKSLSRTKTPQRGSRRSRAFWVLLVFLALVFLLGGSSRKEIPGLLLLRPISILMAFYAIATTTAEQWRTYRAPLVMMAAIVVLTIAHLVPLPPSVWQALAGRGIILDIETLAGQPDIWLPLAMVPGGAWNAFYALFAPIAVFFLAVQLDDRDTFWMLVALTGLALLSGLVGVMQAAGINVQLYAIMSDTPPGLFANRNHQAALLAMLFPMLALIAATGDRFGFDGGFLRVLTAALAIAVVPLVFVTGSRMGLVVSGVAVLSVAAMQLGLLPSHWFRSGSRSKIVAGAAIAGVIAVIGVIGVTMSRNVAVERLALINEDLRYSVWEEVMAFLPGYLPWGSGVGSYAEVYQIHEPSGLLSASYSNHVHNDWLEVVLMAGIPGAALLAAALIMFVVAAWRCRGARGTQSKFNRLGLIMVLVLAIASTVDYPLRTPIMAAVFALATVWSCRPNHAIREVKGRKANV